MFRVAFTFAAICIGLACVGENNIYSLLRLFGVDAPATAPAQAQGASPPQAVQVAMAAPAAKGLQVLHPLADSPVPDAGGYREATIAADIRGQYEADFLINGVSVHGLIDTGASLVTLTPSTAARLGLSANRAGPHYQMQTANGSENVWPVTLNTLAFEGIYMSDVQAVIGESGMGENLFGESFLKRLQSVQQQDGNLVLKQ